MKIRYTCLTLLFLAFSMNCTSNLANQEIKSPASPPVTCDKFAGDWLAAIFIDIEDEDRIICGSKPCWENSRGATQFKLTCKEEKIVGEVILVSGHSHNEANSTIFKPTPSTFQEIRTSLKESRIENGALFLSFTDRRDCSVEINVIPKGEFLFGKFTDKDCKKLTAFDDNENDENVKIKDQAGGILFVNQESKTAF